MTGLLVNRTQTFPKWSNQEEAFSFEENDDTPEMFLFKLGDGQLGNVAFDQGLYDAIKNDEVASDRDKGRQYFVNQDWAMKHIALWNQK